MTEITLRNRIKKFSLAEVAEKLFSPTTLSDSLAQSFEVSDLVAPKELVKGSEITMTMKRFNFICPAEFEVIELGEDNMTYVQTKGILKSWQHKMRLIQKDEAIELQDHIKYEMPFGIFGHLTNDLYFRAEVKDIFYKRLKALGLR